MISPFAFAGRSWRISAGLFNTPSRDGPIEVFEGFPGYALLLPRVLVGLLGRFRYDGHG
jgi:hypothetical protein